MNNLHNKKRNRLTVKRVNKLLYIQINRRTLGRDIKVNVLGEKDETDITEEKAEEAFTHTLAVQKGSEDVVMSLRDELGSYDKPCRLA
jgi:hypothetical protein